MPGCDKEMKLATCVFGLGPDDAQTTQLIVAKQLARDNCCVVWRFCVIKQSLFLPQPYHMTVASWCNGYFYIKFDLNSGNELKDTVPAFLLSVDDVLISAGDVSVDDVLTNADDVWINAGQEFKTCCLFPG